MMRLLELWTSGPQRIFPVKICAIVPIVAILDRCGTVVTVSEVPIGAILDRCCTVVTVSEQ